MSSRFIKIAIVIYCQSAFTLETFHQHFQADANPHGIVKNSCIRNLLKELCAF